ncbi:fungal-specific transcription factor domain-containing protein [Lentinula edodes]|uniref:fungal-specific transcription factor domain-containing protein n=1 Tax=Lentinula edodes TaxID=5353 RepID=UPI001E8EB821|nr:fungal-specific transcription factor domain-containing protein [Lentinula edodes]KAH7869744.1 fungal-specific transcription factor domain-containing protein [Lentinula edodes]
MADSEDSNGPSSTIRPRKRRALRACTSCKKRKVKCDGATMPNNICTSCISLDVECEYSPEQKRRGPKSKLAQPQLRNDVQALISTILSAQRLVVIPSDETLVRDMLVDLATYARSLEQQLERAQMQLEQAQSPSSYAMPSTFRSSPANFNSHNEDNPQDLFSLRVKKVSLDQGDQSYQRHVGSSSHFMFMRTALEIRDKMSSEKESLGFLGKRRNDLWDEFWIRQPWHHFPPEPVDPPHIFPPDDLLRSLIGIYFDLQHNIYPLLHRPIFEREVFTNKLHTSDRRFGAVVLAVCAVGARLSNDPRNDETLYDGTDDERSLGWKYFSQIRMVRTNFTEHPSLYEVQLYALALLFMFPTPVGDAGWSTCGLAVRFALEVGAHRKQYIANKPKQDRIEAELWRRAFWNIVTTDLVMSIALGRPRSVKEDDFDVELPLECDDEFWEHPTDPFVQPKGQISQMSFWYQNVKLLRIVGLVKDNLYSTRKSAPWLDSSAASNADIVIEIDSALNNWLDALPDHLKWNPHHPDDNAFVQLVALHGNYYWVQIQAHKLFIRSDSLSTSSFPSLAICTNAARSFAHIIQAYHSRPNSFMLSLFIAPMFLSATMLLINTWTSLRAKANYDPRKDMNDVSKILQILSIYEKRLEMAGRVREMLLAVMGIDHMTLTASPEKPALKRSRPSDTPMKDNTTLTSNHSRVVRDEDSIEQDSEGWADFSTALHSTGSQQVVSAIRSSFQVDDNYAPNTLAPIQPISISPIQGSGSRSSLTMFDPVRESSASHRPTSINMQINEMPTQLPTPTYTDLGPIDPVTSAWGDPG